MLPKNSLLVLCDFETTGVDPDSDFPIEVGILCCDAALNVVGAYESLIFLPEWRDPFWGAVPIHGITLPMLHGAPGAEDVTRCIRACVERCQKMLKARTPTIVSDNAQFEYRFMKRLFELGKWTDFAKFFHYCAWDTSLLLEATGVGDPKPRHRAMADVGLLHTALSEALRRTGQPLA